MRSDNGKLEHSVKGAHFILWVANPVLSGIQESLIIILETQLYYRWDCEIMFGLATSSTHIVHLPPSQSRCPHSAPCHSSTAPSDMLELPSRQPAHSSLPIQFKNWNISTFTKTSNKAVWQRTGFWFLSFYHSLSLSSTCNGFNGLWLEIYAPGWGAGMGSAPCRNPVGIYFQALAAMLSTLTSTWHDVSHD